VRFFFAIGTIADFFILYTISMLKIFFKLFFTQDFLPGICLLRQSRASGVFSFLINIETVCSRASNTASNAARQTMQISIFPKNIVGKKFSRFF